MQVSHSKPVYMYDLCLDVSSAIYAQTVAILFYGAIAITYTSNTDNKCYSIITMTASILSAGYGGSHCDPQRCE